MYTCIFMYLFITLIFVLIGCVVVNPYGHLTKRQEWTQIIFGSVFWPVLLIYVIGCVIYDSWNRR